MKQESKFKYAARVLKDVEKCDAKSSLSKKKKTNEICRENDKQNIKKWVTLVKIIHKLPNRYLLTI